MKIVGVIDLQRGVAVHAKGGTRADYQAVRMAAGVPIEGDAERLARTYVEQLGVEEIYVADLDAIERRAPVAAAVQRVAAIAPVWLDAGVRSADEARAAQGTGVSRVVVGLETLGSMNDLRDIVAAASGASSGSAGSSLGGTRSAGGRRVAFSLDLRDGLPIADGALNGLTVEALAAAAVLAGVDTVIVLDLARVGAAGGVDLDVVQRVRRAAPDVELIAGGGVRNTDDVAALARAGVDGVLVATALHNGGVSGHGKVTR